MKPAYPSQPSEERRLATIRWAKAGAILYPGVQFIAIVGERMYAYEESIGGKRRVI